MPRVHRDIVRGHALVDGGLEGVQEIRVAGKRLARLQELHRRVIVCGLSGGFRLPAGPVHGVGRVARAAVVHSLDLAVEPVHASGEYACYIYIYIYMIPGDRALAGARACNAHAAD